MNAFQELAERLGGTTPWHAASADHGPPTPPLYAYNDQITEPPQAPRTSRWQSVADWEGKPVSERPFLVPGWIPSNTVTLFNGDGGSGKSLASLMLAVATVLNRPWLGMHVNGGPALYLSAEDDTDELHRRTFDMVRNFGCGWRDLSRLSVRSVAGEDALLAREGQFELLESALFRDLETRAAADAPKLIVIDTLADVFPSNENDRAKARQFIGLLRGLAMRHQSAVLLLAHPSLSGMASGSGTSGSTGWNNSVRSRLYLSRVIHNGLEPEPDRRNLQVMKANYGRVGAQIDLRWCDGVFLTEGPPTGLGAMASNAKAERVFLKLLDAMSAQGRYVSANPGPTYAPSQFASHPDAEGCTKRILKLAMNALFGQGEIVNSMHGSGAKARSHIARKSGDYGPE